MQKSRSEKVFGYVKFLVFLFVLSQIAGCATKTVAFRGLPPTSNECQQYANDGYSTEFQDKLKSNPKLNESQIIGAATGCYEQRDKLMLGDTSDFIKYQLNFLEFKENGELRDPGQWTAIRDTLSDQRAPKYVVLFVHGWRHDARPDDSNVQAFRSMLAYTARHLHERQKQYPNARVIGIYIGWPGNSWRWKWIDDLQVPAFLTFWQRKKESENVASYVADYIHRIKYYINASDDAAALDRFLIVGHSFGGNLLINALKTDYMNAIPDAAKLDAPIKGVSDLTVLLNPASDFSNWKEIQKNEYEKSGYQKAPDYNSFVYNNKKFFDPRQKPILMAFTGTCDWEAAYKWDFHHDPDSKQARREADGPLDCDWATRWAFTVGQSVAFRADLDQRRAIGHVRAYRVRADSLFQNQNYGTTHELEDNGSDDGVKTVTSYLDAAKELGQPKCPPGANWLGKVQTQKDAKYGRDWDTDTKGIYKIPSAPGSALQMRQSTFRHLFVEPEGEECNFEPTMCVTKTYNTLGPAHDPFWNVASHESIIPDHNAVFSQQLWCLIDQIVLDPITTDK